MDLQYSMLNYCNGGYGYWLPYSISSLFFYYVDFILFPSIALVIVSCLFQTLFCAF